MTDRLPPLTALRAFDAAARHMSFAKAAEELHVTPAALSFQIKSLEENLGTPLFHRLNRAVALTEAGETLAPGCRDGFAALNGAWAAARRLLDAASLTVTAGPAFTAKWLAPRLFEFAQAGFGVGLAGFDDEVEAAVRQVVDNWGGLDIVVSNAAIVHGAVEWLAAAGVTPDSLSYAGLVLSAVAALSRQEGVHINVLDDAHADHVRALLPADTRLDAVSFEQIPTNDAWCRDHGAIFVFDEAGGLTALDFGFADGGAPGLAGGQGEADPRRRLGGRERRRRGAHHHCVPAASEPQSGPRRRPLEGRDRDPAARLSRR